MTRKTRKRKKSSTLRVAKPVIANPSTAPAVTYRPISDTITTKLEHDKQLILRDLRKTTVLSALAIGALFVILFVQ